MYEIVFYLTEQGDSPIDEFLDGLDKKARAKVAAHLSLLEEQGPNLKRLYADHVRGKIRELRVRYTSTQYRFLATDEGLDRTPPGRLTHEKSQGEDAARASPRRPPGS